MTEGYIPFISKGEQCQAIFFQGKYTLEMGTCTVVFDAKPRVIIEYMQEVHVVVKHGGSLVRFKTDEQSASEIEALFQSHRMPEQVQYRDEQE